MVCLASLGVPFCVPATCGEGAILGPGSNGAAWEPCSGQGAALGEAEAAGLCLQSGDGAVCLLAGRRPIGSACRLDASRSASALCEPGSLCWELEPAGGEPRGCACDADCAGEAQPSVCDGDQLRCRPLGRCVDLCEAGSAPVTPGSLADCATEGQRCLGPEGADRSVPHLVGGCF